tara:strand:+ start:747 stop:1436 length:690 start_codon:yes stop_codon:yes gene_type:complete
MKIYVGIQARLSSRRVPQKMLKKINGEYLISYLIKRLKRTIFKDNFFVLTSKNEDDKRLVDYCIKNKIKYFTGSLNNVFSRFYEFANYNKLDSIIRISGDSPLIDPLLLDKMFNYYKQDPKLDLLTNVFPRTFPSGQSIEIFSYRAFKKINNYILTKGQKEHVTKFFYDNYKIFRIKNIKCKYPHQNVKLSIDNYDDLKKFKIFAENVEKNIEDLSIDEIVNIWSSLNQ